MWRRPLLRRPRGEQARWRSKGPAGQRPSAFLWTIPGSVGASFILRNVCHAAGLTPYFEPFSIPYHLADLTSAPLAQYYPKPETPEHRAAAAALCTHLLPPWTPGDPRPSRPAVLVVEHAYYLRGLVGAEPFTIKWLGTFQHSFLICDPAVCVPRLYQELAAVNQPFDAALLGYDVLLDLQRHLRRPPRVLDVADLCAAPEPAMAVYCNSMSWPRPGSLGLTPVLPPAGPAPPEVRRCIERCRPLYEELHARRLLPQWPPA
eukprot:EG_transcript_23866